MSAKETWINDSAFFSPFLVKNQGISIELWHLSYTEKITETPLQIWYHLNSVITKKALHERRLACESRYMYKTTCIKAKLYR